MPENREPLAAKQTLLLILLPLLATFVGLRLYLHLVRVWHIYPGGYLVHHLFIGVFLLLPAALALAFGPRRRSMHALANIAVGIGSAMILDELIYLMVTRATDADYVSPISLFGAIVCVALAVTPLFVLYGLHRD